MYNHYFQLKHAPFSIAPDPRYLFMSERHREALAHLHKLWRDGRLRRMIGHDGVVRFQQI